MSLETFFGGFQPLGSNCVAMFPIAGNEAMEFLKMLGVYNASCPTLRQCRQAKGMGIIAGCSDFTKPPKLTTYYFLTCDGTGHRFTARGVILIPKNSEHELCADAALTQMAEQVAAEAQQKGLKLIS